MMCLIKLKTGRRKDPGNGHPFAADKGKNQAKQGNTVSDRGITFQEKPFRDAKKTKCPCILVLLRIF
jgi:hypothetical protein